ncbi:hypothetical protein ACFPU0_01140 [Pseudomonas sp. GCM10022186]|uniref:hypothetical protein n=1 Tax=Pseudomonas sp. GCM10022186 TaxID=3252650 RepID=UPI003614917D
MKLVEIRRTVLEPALAMLPPALGGARAEVMLLAIGLQESGFHDRRPVSGPERGYWRVDPDDDSLGAVLRHPATAAMAVEVCDRQQVPPIEERVFAALEHDDLLSAVFVRLRLHIEGERLPPVGEVGDAWNLYCRAWRPQEPDRRHWGRSYAQAMDALGATA